MHQHKLTNEVIDQIVIHDPRYVGHTETGAIAIRDPETGVITTYTHGEYIMLAEPQTDEVLFCTVDAYKERLSHLSHIDAATVVAWLDEIRLLASNLRDEHKSATKTLMGMAFRRSESYDDYDEEDDE